MSTEPRKKTHERAEEPSFVCPTVSAAVDIFEVYDVKPFPTVQRDFREFVSSEPAVAAALRRLVHHGIVRTRWNYDENDVVAKWKERVATRSPLCAVVMSLPASRRPDDFQTSVAEEDLTRRVCNWGKAQRKDLRTVCDVLKRGLSSLVSLEAVEYRPTDSKRHSGDGDDSPLSTASTHEKAAAVKKQKSRHDSDEVAKRQKPPPSSQKRKRCAFVDDEAECTDDSRQECDEREEEDKRSEKKRAHAERPEREKTRQGEDRRHGVGEKREQSVKEKGKDKAREKGRTSGGRTADAGGRKKRRDESESRDEDDSDCSGDGSANEEDSENDDDGSDDSRDSDDSEDDSESAETSEDDDVSACSESSEVRGPKQRKRAAQERRPPPRDAKKGEKKDPLLDALDELRVVAGSVKNGAVDAIVNSFRLKKIRTEAAAARVATGKRALDMMSEVAAGSIRLAVAIVDASKSTDVDGATGEHLGVEIANGLLAAHPLVQTATTAASTAAAAAAEAFDELERRMLSLANAAKEFDADRVR